MTDPIIATDAAEASAIIQAALRDPKGERELFFIRPRDPVRANVRVALQPIFQKNKFLRADIAVELPNGDVIAPQGAHAAACCVMTALSLLTTSPITTARTARKGA